MAGSGAEDLRRLGQALKELGDKEIRKETLRALKAPAKRLGEDARDRAGTVLPGGLGEYIAGTRVTVQARMSGQNASIRVRGVRRKQGGLVDLDAIDRGRLRHPLFGDRRHWYTQQVQPGWWTKAMEAGAPAVRAELARVIGDAIARAVKR